MIRYAAVRLLQIIPVLFGISIIVFLLVRLIPGDPAIAVLGSRATPELVQRVHDQLGLDLPLWQQYLHYLANALRGNFGVSFFYQADVWDLTVARLPTTIALMAYSILLSLVVAVPFAVLALVCVLFIKEVPLRTTILRADELAAEAEPEAALARREG